MRRFTVICVLPKDKVRKINTKIFEVTDEKHSIRFSTVFASDPECLMDFQNSPIFLTVMYLPSRNSGGYGESARKMVRKLDSSENFFLLTSDPHINQKDQVYRIEREEDLQERLLSIIESAVKRQKLAFAA